MALSLIDPKPKAFAMCISPLVKRNQLIGWTVSINDQSIDVLVSDLPAPGYPTEHQIRHTAACKLQGLPADKVAFAMAIDAAFEVALVEWERSESIRRECVRITGIDHKKAARIEDSYLDYSTVTNFDDAAKTIAYELPELGWNADGDNGSELWAIVSQKPTPKPKRTDEHIRQDAIAALTMTATKTETVPF